MDALGLCASIKATFEFGAFRVFAAMMFLTQVCRRPPPPSPPTQALTRHAPQASPQARPRPLAPSVFAAMPTTPCQVYNSMLTVVIPFYLVYVAHVGVAQLGAAAAVERAFHP